MNLVFHISEDGSETKSKITALRERKPTRYVLTWLLRKYVGICSVINDQISQTT